MRAWPTERYGAGARAAGRHGTSAHRRPGRAAEGVRDRARHSPSPHHRASLRSEKPSRPNALRLAPRSGWCSTRARASAPIVMGPGGSVAGRPALVVARASYVRLGSAAGVFLPSPVFARPQVPSVNFRLRFSWSCWSVGSAYPAPLSVLLREFVRPPSHQTSSGHRDRVRSQFVNPPAPHHDLLREHPGPLTPRSRRSRSWNKENIFMPSLSSARASVSPAPRLISCPAVGVPSAVRAGPPRRAVIPD